MKLQKSSKIIRWAYLFERLPYNGKTSLCAVFWLSVLVTPLLCLLCAALSPIIIPVLLWKKYASAPYRRWLQRREDVANEKWEKKYYAKLAANQLNPPQPSALAVLWEGLKAVKAKACPIVEIVE